MITDQDIERLEELAKKATPGPWSHEPTSFNKLDRILYSNRTGSMHGLNLMTLADGDWNHVNNVEFIALANPTTILPLIERLREAEKHLRALQDFANGQCTQAEMDAEEAVNRNDEWGEAHANGRAVAYAKILGRAFCPALLETLE